MNKPHAIVLLLILGSATLVFAGCRRPPDPVTHTPLAGVPWNENLLLRDGVVLMAGSHAEAHPVESLLDNNPATFWHVDEEMVGSAAWVEADFGEGEGVVVRSLAARPRRGFGFQFFRHAEVQASHDGDEWKTLARIEVPEEPENRWQYFSFPGREPYRFWRLLILDGFQGPGHFWSLADLAFFESSRVVEPPVVSRKSSRPPIILIVVDALRADRLGGYGYSRPTTPNIDRFAEEAVLFEMALSPSPFSAPSFMSLFTALAPPVHATNNISFAIKLYPRPPDRMPLLAEVLKRQGYLTVGMHGEGNIPRVRGFDRGFDYYQPDFQRWQMKENASPAGLRNIINDVRRWLEKSREDEKPVFLFLHHLVCHDPYIFGPSEFRLRFLDDPVPGWPLSLDDLKALGPDLYENFWREVRLGDPRHRAHISALYDGGVYYSDYIFREFIDVLKEVGIYDEALIVLASDHGEALGERGQKGHGDLWIEHIHVPLLIRFPGAQFAGRRVGETVTLMDVAPTIYDYLEISLEVPLQGTSLLPRLDRRAGVPAPPVASYRAPLFSPYFLQADIRIMDGRYVYIHRSHSYGPLLNRYREILRPTAPSFAPPTAETEEMSVNELVKLADYYFDRDNFGEAERLYRRALEMAPEDGSLRLRIVPSLMGVGFQKQRN